MGKYYFKSYIKINYQHQYAATMNDNNEPFLLNSSEEERFETAQ